MAPYNQQEKASDLATPQNDSNNSGAYWAIDLPLENVANYVNEIDIENIFESPAAPPIHRSAVDAAQPCDSTSQKWRDQRPSSATTGGNRSGRRSFTDEEIRQRRKERQRHYRERQREERAEVEKKINVTAAEIEAELAQQDALLTERTVFTKVVDYCSSTVSVASSLVASTIGAIRSEYNHAVDEGLAWFVLQLYTPSDAQLQAYLARTDLEELDNMSTKMTERCIGLFNRWNKEPEERENIEAELEKIRGLRLRCITHLATTRPEIAIELASRRLMPTSPDGAPNPKLVEAVAALELTPEQLESFEREWVLYLQKTESIRQEAQSTLSFLASSGANENAAAFCAIGASGLFLDRLQAVQELETHPSSEATAIFNLRLWLQTRLTSQQRAILMKYSMPYYPDAIQLGRIVFGDDCGKDVSAAKLQSLTALES
jgi:hypothetical protein